MEATNGVPGAYARFLGFDRVQTTQKREAGRVSVVVPSGPMAPHLPAD